MIGKHILLIEPSSDLQWPVPRSHFLLRENGPQGLHRATWGRSSLPFWKGSFPWSNLESLINRLAVSDAEVSGQLRRSQGRSDFTFTFHFHALEEEMAAHSSVLAWRIPGTGEPGGLPSMGSHRVGHDWSDLAAAAVTSKSDLLPFYLIKCNSNLHAFFTGNTHPTFLQQPWADLYISIL